MKLFERLLDTDVKADILTLFHNNPNLSDTAEGLARRLGRSPGEVQKEVEDLVELGILRKSEVYAFGSDRDKEIQDAISKQLVLGQFTMLEGLAEGGSGAAAQISRSRTGIDVLDKVLPDGLPDQSSVLVLSDPGGGEEHFLAHFVSRQLEAGKSVLFVTLDNFPANVRQLVLSHLSREIVDWSSLVFIDCYSTTVGLESEEDHTADPENLSAIGIAMSDVMAKRAISVMVLDSFNTLIRKRGAHSAMEFLRVFVARTRQAKALSFVTMNRKAFHPAIVASAEDIVDGVIELKADETPDGIARSLRILRMIGAKHLTSWVPYDISDDGKLVPAPRQVI